MAKNFKMEKINIFKKIYRKIIYKLSKKFFSSEISLKQQNKNFENINLNRQEGLEKLNIVLNKLFNEEYNEKNGMFSEHLILLSSFSINSKTLIKNILEIGTFDGRTALILSELFKEANILTVDLDENSEFKSIYNRSLNFEKFCQKRDSIISKNKKIKFLPINSVQLINSDNTFDLIWIDGAHGYPVVTVDIINSLRMINEEGWIFIDDVWQRVDSEDNYYKSTASYETIKTLKDSNLISNFNLIPKRLGHDFNLSWEKKFIGLFQKNTKL